MFFIAVTEPTCSPTCGKNAHCEYGVFENSCVCNTGTTGNPYEGCDVQHKNMCSTTSCGVGAQCKEGLNTIECVCPQGYIGNPYVNCFDIDECSTQVCAENALCINTPGSYDCKCKKNFAGNPFEMCSSQRNFCDDPKDCTCNEKVLCPVGFSCERGKCKNLCNNVACGPRAACDNGQCVCPPGFSGDAYDTKKGCLLIGQCRTDFDCKSSEICFQIGKGLRKCLDGCSKTQCGPNALCVTNDHRSGCVCADGSKGNPLDLARGCSQEQKHFDTEGCTFDSDCGQNELCKNKQCINPCDSIACGKNEICKIQKKQPICDCQDGFIWNPDASMCDKPSIPDCSHDEECNQNEACQSDVLGVLKCVPVCSAFNCPANSVCVSNNHQGSCQCSPGYSGNPNDRNGCRAERKNECSTNAECPESDVCENRDGIFKCVSVCEKVKCGPFAICITNNHIAQCNCPPGSYAGNPYDLTKGCQQVPCVYNQDCPSHQLCNRQTHSCYDVCGEDTCGENAVCLAENHKSQCTCPAGYRPNPIPDQECVPIEGCNPSHCHPTAVCEMSPEGAICKCPHNSIGDPYTAGCRLQEEGDCPNGDLDCPINTVCIGSRCTDPCENTCGQNSRCNVVDRKAVCSCPNNFMSLTGNPQDGCVRVLVGCNSDVDCNGGLCQNNQCKVVCRTSSDCSTGEKCVHNSCVVPCSGHNQCGKDQACVNGGCIIGCRSNKNCNSNEQCSNHKCQNPCLISPSCGPNAICDVQDHRTVCKCPPGFEGNPRPEQSCVRVPEVCSKSSECPKNYECIGNKCNFPCKETSNCAVGERCFNKICSKVCYTNNNCLPGEICNEGGICVPGCSSDIDCLDTQVCLQAKCKCRKGYTESPFGCADINECQEQLCHSTAVCENTPGSYKCSCPPNTVGDPYAEPGCRKPSECYKNEDCAENLGCYDGKCRDLCKELSCGPNAVCLAADHEAECACSPGHLGNPLDQSIGCFKVDCLSNEECSSDRQCNADSNKCLSKIFIVIFFFNTFILYQEIL